MLNCQLQIANCMKCGDSLYISLSLTICQRPLAGVSPDLPDYPETPDACGSGNPRAWTSVPGRFPSFLYIIYRDQRIAAP